MQIIYNADVCVYKTVAVWCNFYLFKETLKILIYNRPTSVKISADECDFALGQETRFYSTSYLQFGSDLSQASDLTLRKIFDIDSHNNPNYSVFRCG